LSQGAVVIEGKPLPDAAEADDVRAEESRLVVAVERDRSLVLRRIAVVRARNRRRYRHDGERRRSRSQQKKLPHRLSSPGLVVKGQC
jgi:hypothetical protein